MITFDRRQFLSSLAGSIVVGAAHPLHALQSATQAAPPAAGKAPALPVMPAGTCWLDVAAPFVVVDPSQDLTTQLLFTATCFPGTEGFRDTRYATEYQILLYDNHGKEVTLDSHGRLEIEAMRPRLVNMRDYAHCDTFIGGARVRVAPSPEQVVRAGDLFSAGFVRWDMPTNFDNVHAHPEPPMSITGQFNYSMPIPALSEYHCAFALFNPNDDATFGDVRVVDRLGKTIVKRRFNLDPHQTMLFTMADMKEAATPGQALAIAPLTQQGLADGGVVVVHNESEHVAFAYTLMKGRTGNSFTVEHPLHYQDVGDIKPARETPYGPNQSFPASSMIYTPMLFRHLQIGGIELNTRHYLSASRWQEAALWNLPFVTTDRGQIAWVSNKDDGMAQRISPTAVTNQGAIRLGEFQSCRIDTHDLPLPDNFSGGFGVATIPKTSHSLNKIEVRVAGWDRVAFTHFRPGGTVAKGYQNVEARGGLATDYIVSGVQIIGTPAARKRDSVLAIMNIEFDDEVVGTPTLQIFGPSGLLGEKRLDDFQPLACRHLLVSELFPGLQSDPAHPMTVRMTAKDAIMIMSVLHIDYERKDIAMDHGSDRHSTFADYKC